MESHRGKMTTHFQERVDLRALVERTDRDGSLDVFPAYLDLRFGNTCNLSCVMCTFPISSRLGAGRTPVWTTAHVDPYTDDDELWHTIETNASSIRYLYIAGGEPFLQTAHLRLLELLIACEAAAAIEIHYNSNLTVLPHGIFESLAQFKSVTIAASCDGTQKLFEAIRVGAQWDVFVSNLRRARDHVQILLDVTVQRDNITAVADLLRFADAEHVPLRLENILQWPPHLSVRSIPETERHRIAADLDLLAARCETEDRTELAGQIRRVVQYMTADGGISRLNASEDP